MISAAQARQETEQNVAQTEARNTELATTFISEHVEPAIKSAIESGDFSCKVDFSNCDGYARKVHEILNANGYSVTRMRSGNTATINW